MSDEVTFTEQVEAEVSPVERPEGSPGLVPFKAVPRRQRAAMMRKFEAVAKAKDALESAQGAAEGAPGVTPTVAAAIFDLTAEVEEMLAVAAVDRAAYDAWAAEADDNALLALFAWYTSRFQVGE